MTGILAQSVARESHNLEVGSSSLPDPNLLYFFNFCYLIFCFDNYDALYIIIFLFN